MKLLLLSITIHFIMCFEQQIYAQVPKYDFNLYFEDAVGRIDSVKFLYDKILDDFSERKRFGWKDISRVPFNYNFEVRCANLGGQDPQSKIYADYYGDGFCDAGLPQMNSINIRATDFPVRMYWDSTYFANDDCLDWSRFTRYFNFALHPWDDPSIYYKMSERSEFLITKKWLLETEDFRNIYQHDVEGGGKDSIFVIFIGIASELDGTISTKDEKKDAFIISPNPVNDVLRLSTNQNIGSINYEIINVNGTIVLRGSIAQSSYNIDVSNLDSGMYLITIKDYNDKRLMKFIKH